MNTPTRWQAGTKQSFLFDDLKSGMPPVFRWVFQCQIMSSRIVLTEVCFSWFQMKSGCQISHHTTKILILISFGFQNDNFLTLFMFGIGVWKGQHVWGFQLFCLKIELALPAGEWVAMLAGLDTACFLASHSLWDPALGFSRQPSLVGLAVPAFFKMFFSLSFSSLLMPDPLQHSSC